MRQIRIGAILQYIQVFASILIGILYTPLLLRLLGQSEYGIYHVAASIIAYLSLLSLGFGSSYVRFYTLKKKTCPDKIPSLNALYFSVFCFIGLFVLVFGLIFALNPQILVNETYSISDIVIMKRLLILMAINLAISFPMSVFASFITVHEKFIFLRLINIGKTVFSPGLSIIAVFLGFGSVGLIMSTTVVNIFVDFINIFYCFKKLKMKMSFKNIEFSMLKPILSFSIFIAINHLIDQINWQTDKIILGKMITSSAVSIYAIGSSLNNYYVLFSTSISGLFSPRIHKVVVENKDNADKELTKLMSSVGRVQFFILLLILTGYIFFGRFFVTKWAGEDYGDSYVVGLLLMIPETVPLIQNIGIEIQRAKNKHKFRSVVYLVMALINVAISIVLCRYYGVVGVALGTTVSIVIANIFIMNIYYHKKLNIDMRFFWKEILCALPSLIIPISFGLLLNIMHPINTFFDFIRQVVCYIAIYLLSVTLLGLNKKEKSVLANLFIKKNH